MTLRLCGVLAALILPSLVATGALATNHDYEQVVNLTFPVAGPNSYSDDYHAGRSGGRVHRATDVFAKYGQRVHAAVGGEITWITGLDGNPPSYGYMITIAGTDGRSYSYVHLGRQDGPPSEAYAPGLERGSRVERGQWIGFVGCSGNASCNAPHLHFEIEDPRVTDPYGTNRINPYPSLRDAERRGDLPGARRVIPLVGDWNGNGRSTPGWYYVDESRFRLRFGLGATAREATFRYGRPGDLPVVGDWNGDGRATVGVVRNRTWLLRNSNSGGAADLGFDFGRVGDQPVAGDWNGNGVTTAGVVRGRTWLLRRTNRIDSGHVSFNYGRADDTPIVGDWGAAGRTTVGVVRGRTWLLRHDNSSGPADLSYAFGRAADTPVTGDWSRDGSVTAGVIRGSNWYLTDSHAGGAADRTVHFEP